MKGKSKSSSPDAVAAPNFELCYGVARDQSNKTVLVPIVVKKLDNKVTLYGVDSEGDLIGPYEGRELLTQLGIQTWVQGTTLQPVKDRPTLWQRSLISAVIENVEAGLKYSSFCQESYRGKTAAITDSLKPSLEFARKLLRSYMKQHGTDLLDKGKSQAKKRKSAAQAIPLTVLGALTTLLEIVSGYQEQARKVAERYGVFSRGERANCDGCGTSLPDLHRACGEGEGCGNVETFCMSCPGNCCVSCKRPYEVYDQFLTEKTNQHHPYVERAFRFCDTYVPGLLQKAQTAPQDATLDLPKECRKEGYYSVSEKQFKGDGVVQSTLLKGLPVLVKGVGDHFDPSPFTVEALQAVAKTQDDLADQAEGTEENVPRASVKMQPSSETLKETNASSNAFFEPIRSLADAPCDPPGDHSYILADLGIQPEEQADALYKGCEKLGIGDLIRPTGRKNLCSYLLSGDEDPLCGTRKPDLGPKLYIARPCVREHEGRKVFQGRTYTRLHCDLSDAVNYSYGDGSAIWTVFAADDRKKLQEVLDKKKRDLYFVSGPVFLSGEELAAMEIPYAQFVQGKGDLVLIPAGCAHQVENCSHLPTIKVAQDFLAEESVERCWQMNAEMRKVEAVDKLQLPLTLIGAAAKSDELLEASPKAKRRKSVPPSAPAQSVLTPPTTQPPEPQDTAMDTQPEEEEPPLPQQQQREGPQPADDVQELESPQPGNDTVAYTPPQALSTVHGATVTGLHPGYSDALKMRSGRVEKACMEAENQVRVKEERKSVADGALEVTQKALNDAVNANNAALASQKAASEALQKARDALKARDLEKLEVQEEVKIRRAEAKKLLECFPDD